MTTSSAYPLWSTRKSTITSTDDKNVLFTFTISGATLETHKRRRVNHRLESSSESIFDIGEVLDAADTALENEFKDGHEGDGTHNKDTHDGVSDGGDVHTDSTHSDGHVDAHDDGSHDAHSDAHEMVVHVTYEDICELHFCAIQNVRISYTYTNQQF